MVSSLGVELYMLCVGHRPAKARGRRSAPPGRAVQARSNPLRWNAVEEALPAGRPGKKDTMCDGPRRTRRNEHHVVVT
jgi:hypothetical protein